MGSQVVQVIEQQFEQAKQLIGEQDYAKAKLLLASLIEQVEAQSEQNEDSEAFSFHSFLEVCLYKAIFEPKKRITQLPTDNSSIYAVYGSLLVELEDHEGAICALEKSLQWNPLHVRALLELSEIYKARKQWPAFLATTKECMEYASSSRDLARCYRNLGFYYMEQQDEDTAICLYFLSNSYDTTTVASAQLHLISEKLGETLVKPELKHILNVLSEKDIALGANPIVVDMVLALAQSAEEQGKKKAAIKYYRTGYELTGNASVKAKLDKLQG